MMNPNLSESLGDAGGRKSDHEMMKARFRELVAAKRLITFSPIKLPPIVGTGYSGIPGRPRLLEFLRDSFSRDLGFVYEFYGALYRKPQCLLHCWIEPEGFYTIDDGEITYTYNNSSSPVPYSKDHTEHMERLARLALEAHHHYYSGEEGYLLLSLEKVVFKKSINEYYITFTARQIGAPASDVKTMKAIVVNYFDVFDFVLYVKIITSDNTCCHCWT